jgi:hypothetical protein
MEDVFLPVEMTCFDCYKDNTFGCSSFNRVCLKCAHNYLQLDKNISERDFVKRCLFCMNIAPIRFINSQNAYRKDFLLMMKNNKEQKCPYCSEFNGDQINIDKHLDKSCPEFYDQCECGKLIQRKDVELHRSNCIYYTRCKICDVLVREYNILDHYMEEHDLVKCSDCKYFIKSTSIIRHALFHCPERLNECLLCQEKVPVRTIMRHYEHHLIELETSMLRLLRDYKRVKNILQGNNLLM